MGELITAVKQYVSATRSPPPPSPYECQGCGARFAAQRQVCPTCGGYTIERTDWPRLDQ